MRLVVNCLFGKIKMKIRRWRTRARQVKVKLMTTPRKRNRSISILPKRTRSRKKKIRRIPKRRRESTVLRTPLVKLVAALGLNAHQNKQKVKNALRMMIAQRIDVTKTRYVSRSTHC
jgi:hypothetical protein